MLARFLINATLSVVLFCICLSISWHIFSQNNFLFGQLYEYNEIQEHVEKYAPQNRNRDNFDITTKTEHVRIFSEIVEAINNNGFGLDEIVYKTDDGKVIDKFLTEAEIEHLHDVSVLVKNANIANIFLMLAFFGLILFFWVYKVIKGRYFWKPFSVLAAFFNMYFLLTILGAAIFAIGPQNIFYILHELFFANKGQWYFYFQESLMTTLMPETIFASIAVLLVTIALLIWIFLSYLIVKILS